MAAKEALSKIVNYDINDSGKCVADYCEEECEVVAKAIAELEELKRDVKRYFETTNMAEWSELGTKLSKLGKEE